MNPVWFDSHAHLDDRSFDHDRSDVIETAIAAGVETIVNIGYRPQSWRTTVQLAVDYPAVTFTLGFHPLHAKECSHAGLESLARLAEERRPVAIGEIGLDYFRKGPTRAVQAECLRQQLRLANSLGLPAVIHQRAAESDLVDLFEAEPALPHLVLHSFDGTARFADFARERGSTIGVGGLAIRPGASKLRDILRSIDPMSVVLETDAPYLAPSPAPSRRNEPANIPLIGQVYADLWGFQLQEFAARTTATARTVFGGSERKDTNSVSSRDGVEKTHPQHESASLARQKASPS